MQSTKYTETETDAVRRQWLVAYVQSCLEKRTARRLAAMGIECYLPIQSEIHQWSDRRKRVDRLIIPMMIFVHVTPQERALPLSLQAVNRYMVLRGESVRFSTPYGISAITASIHLSGSSFIPSRQSLLYMMSIFSIPFYCCLSDNIHT